MSNMFEEFNAPRKPRRSESVVIPTGRFFLWVAAFSWVMLMFACIVAGLARVGDGPAMPDVVVLTLIVLAMFGTIAAFVVDRLAFADKGKR